jgi:anti-sigma regulatory factor (Ser/Thr protein kinase)
VKDEVELRFPARAEHLALVRLVVSHLAQQGGAGLDLARMDDLRLAVSEACANAIEAYGRLGRDGDVVTIRLQAEAGLLVVEVRDDAGGFDPSALVTHPPVETPERLEHERGLGVPLMRQLADELAFQSQDGGTTVRMSFGSARRAG